MLVHGVRRILTAATLFVLAAFPPSVAIIQHSTRLELAERYHQMLRLRVVKQGDNALSFYG